MVVCGITTTPYPEINTVFVVLLPVPQQGIFNLMAFIVWYGAASGTWTQASDQKLKDEYSTIRQCISKK